MDCEHLEFATFAVVNRLTRSDDDPTVVGFHADVRIRCAVCAAPFAFVGLPGGLIPDRPTVSVDGLELRAPIRLAD